MDVWTSGSKALAHVHKEANNTKFSGYFTGFLEGILASGSIRELEIEPLLTQCAEQLENLGDEDANDLLEDYQVGDLDFDNLSAIIEYRIKELNKNCKKTEMNRFMGFCAAVACDNDITFQEAEGVIKFSKDFPSIVDDVCVRVILSECNDAVEDGTIHGNESEQICAAITGLVGDSFADTGVSSLGSVPNLDILSISNLSEFYGKTIVLTGNFRIKPRKIIEESLRSHGATTKSVPCKNTDLVMIANESSRDWVFSHKGRKLAKAIELNSETGCPQFISENNTLRLLGL